MNDFALHLKLDTCYERILECFNMPFKLYDFQEVAVNDQGYAERSALWWEPGLGKTAGSTHVSLFKLLTGQAEMVLTLLPPILIPLWARWLRKITRKDGTPLKVVVYQGPPAKREKIALDGDFILMSIQIFKRDITRIERDLANKKVHVVVDEAHCLKDVGTGNYKTVRDFCVGKSLQLLTGTPLNSPGDAYAYVKLISPTIYRNLKMFEQIHVAKRDFFDKPIEWQNLDLLQSNLMNNADRKTKEEVLTELPPCIITQLDYELDPAHMRLYRKLVDEQLLKLPDGDKIDATEATALYHALGQIIMQWHHFGQDENLKSAGYDLIEAVIDELGDKKLIIFGNYKRTNQELVRRLKCPGIWGEIPPAQKQAAWDRFLDDPNCRQIVLHPVAAGQGLDGAQHVCHDIIYAEPPIAVSHLTQSLSRVHRDGQTIPVTVRLAMAMGTVHAYRVRQLMLKEALVNGIQMSRAMLREALLGGL